MRVAPLDLYVKIIWNGTVPDITGTIVQVN